MLKRVFAGFAVVFFCLGFFQSVSAQEEEDVLKLDEVVITGTKTERRLKDAPVRTEIITSKEIEDKGATDLYEALEGIPGIRVEKQCSYCNFSMVRMQGLSSGHVQVLIDGMPIYSGLAGVYGLQQIPARSIERIEIIKGAASALYGSSAIAGVINIITKKPGKKPEATVNMQFGQHNTNNYGFDASFKKDKMDVMLTAQKNTGDAFNEPDPSDKDYLPAVYSDRVMTDDINTGVRINWYDISGGDKLTLTGRTLNELRAGGNLTDNTFENPFTESTERIITQRYEAGINYRKRFLSDSEIAVNLAYAKHHRNATNDTFLDDYKATHNGDYPSLDEMRPYLADELISVIDANYSFPLGEIHRLLVGAQYNHNKLDETGKYCVVGSSTDPTADDYVGSDYGKAYLSESEKHADEFGFYVQDEIKASEKTDIILGGRFDAHKSEDNFAGSGDIAMFKNAAKISYNKKAFNPRVALKYVAAPGLTLRSSVGTGFRVPYGFSEDLHLCSGSPRVYKGAGLEPEKSVSFNFGADYAASLYSFLSVNLFRTNLKDKIGFGDASETAKKFGYTYEWKNLSDAYTQGVELAAEFLPAHNVSFDWNFAYTDAQYSKERADWAANHPEFASVSKYIPRVPSITSRVKLTYSPGDWKFVLDNNYTGRMYIDYAEDEEIANPNSKIKHTDGFWVVDTKLTKSFPSARLSLFAGVKNLFDYVQPEKHRDDAAFMWAPYTGRLVYGGMEIKF